MTHGSISIYLALLLILIVFSYLGWHYRTCDPDEYHTLRRQAPGLRLVSSLFTIVGASEFVVFFTISYYFGILSVLFFLGALIGFILLALICPEIRKNSTEHNLYSIPDLAERIQSRTSFIMLSILCIIFTFILTLIQIIIGGSIFHAALDIEPEYANFAVAVCVGLYLFWGGYKALLFTDLIQAGIMLSFTFFVLLFSYATISNDANMSINYFTDVNGLEVDLAFLIIGGFFAIVGGPEIWQRILTARSDRTAQKSLVLSGATMLIWGAAIVLLSLLQQQILPPDQLPDDAFFSYLLSDIPPWAVGMIAVLLTSAILSTADTEIFAAAVITHRELARRKGNSPLSIRRSQIIISILLLLAYALSLYTENIVNTYFSLVYLTFITGPAAIALIYFRSTPPLFIATVCISFLCLVYIISENAVFSWWPGLVLLPWAGYFLFRISWNLRV